MKNMDTKNETIGKNIRIAREEAGLSQLDLAKALGFESATAVSLIESGERKISAENLSVLARTLHRDMKFFFGQEENSIDVQVALRADKDLNKEDREAILRFIELAKKKHGK
jgi:transcriptional regulator with XRE-family HTH domain